MSEVYTCDFQLLVGHMHMHAGKFGSEEAAAEAWDKVLICKAGASARASTNFPLDLYDVTHLQGEPCVQEGRCLGRVCVCMYV